MRLENAFLKLALAAVGAASTLNASPADAPPPAALKAAAIDVIRPGTTSSTTANATAPAALPGNGPAQHPFLYAGEWDTRKPLEQSMFLLRDGKVVRGLSSWQDPDLGPSTSIQLLDKPGALEDQQR